MCNFPQVLILFYKLVNDFQSSMIKSFYRVLSIRSEYYYKIYGKLIQRTGQAPRLKFSAEQENRTSGYCRPLHALPVLCLIESSYRHFFCNCHDHPLAGGDNYSREYDLWISNEKREPCKIDGILHSMLGLCQPSFQEPFTSTRQQLISIHSIISS